MCENSPFLLSKLLWKWFSAGFRKGCAGPQRRRLRVNSSSCQQDASDPSKLINQYWMSEMRLNAPTPLIMARKMKISWRIARNSEDFRFLTLSSSDGFCNTFPIHSWIFYIDFLFLSFFFFKHYPISWVFVFVEEMRGVGCFPDLVCE